MKKTDSLFSDIQDLCNAGSDWLIKKSIIQLKPTIQYPAHVCVTTAEPVKRAYSARRSRPLTYNIKVIIERAT